MVLILEFPPFACRSAGSIVCLKMDLSGKAGFGVRFAFTQTGWLKVPRCWGRLFICWEVAGMELLRVPDLCYLGWMKATDHTKHCEFFFVYHERIISLLFGRSSIFWVGFERRPWKCLISKGTQGVLFSELTGSLDRLRGLWGLGVVLFVAKSKHGGQDRNLETLEGRIKIFN